MAIKTENVGRFSVLPPLSPTIHRGAHRWAIIWPRRSGEVSLNETSTKARFSQSRLYIRKGYENKSKVWLGMPTSLPSNTPDSRRDGTSGRRQLQRHRAHFCLPHVVPPASQEAHQGPILHDGFAWSRKYIFCEVNVKLKNCDNTSGCGSRSCSRLLSYHHEKHEIHEQGVP